MSHNTFGHLFRVTTWGESHGPAIGCVVDGCPPGIRARRRPTSRAISTSAGRASRASRRSASEPDEVEILSGVFADDGGRQVTTGTPIALDDRQRRPALQGLRRHQGQVPARPRRLTYWQKYGIRDYRGGGRSSARETAMRVAAGAVARKVLGRRHDPRRAGADRAAQDRPRALGLGRGRRQPVLLPRPGTVADLGRLTSTACARPAPRPAR